MSATSRHLLAAAALTAALAACDDPYAIEAQREVVTDTVLVYGINEAPAGAPTALSLIEAGQGNVAIVANGAFAFDVAVDIRTGGDVALIPNSRVASGLITPYRVGLQKFTGSYDALTRAPSSGYAYDSVLVVRPGEGVAIESANPSACPLPVYGTAIYGKLVVDSVKTNPGRAFLRATVDPNCGFRSLAPGLPKE